MIYLLDSSAVITAKNEYYQFDRVPEFWDWLVFHAEAGRIKIPPEIYGEIIKQDDELKVWIQKNKSALVYNEEPYLGLVSRVLEKYTSGRRLTDDDLEHMGADPYLVACACAQNEATVVTGEVHKPSIQGAKRRIPNICEDMGVNWTNIPGLSRKKGLVTLLDFKTDWFLHH